VSVSSPMSPPSADALGSAPTTAQAVVRNDQIDAMRAIGILLVMVGHLPALSDWLDRLVFSFHVPLFFWVSGWLLDPRRLRGPAVPAVAGTVRRLLPPYLVFFLMSWAYWMATRNIGGRAEDFVGVMWSDPWIGFFQGVGPAILVNSTLWFFPCLLVTTVAFLLLHALAGRWQADAGIAIPIAIGMFGFAMLATLPFTDVRWPWGLDILPAALVFLAAGQACRLAWPRLQPVVGARGLPAALLWGAVLLAWAWWALQGERIDMQYLGFGDSPLMFVVVALAGIALSLRLAGSIPGHPVVRWLGANTLILFPTHVLIFNFLTGVGKLFLGLSAEALRTPTAGAVFILVTLLLSVPVVVVTRALLDVLDRRLPGR